MQHLVVHEVFNRVAGNGGPIKDSAYDNSIVRRVEVAKTLPRRMLAPSHLRPGQESIEEAAVQIFKNRVEIIEPSLSGNNSLPPANLPDEMCFGGEIVAGRIPSVAQCMSAVYRFAVKLGEEDVGYRMQHGFRRSLQQVRQPHQHLAFAHADGVIDVGKMIKSDFDFR